MREQEAAEFKTRTFKEHMGHARAWKNELRSLMTQTFSKCALAKLNDTHVTMFAISTVSGTATQSLFAAEIPIESLNPSPSVEPRQHRFDLKHVFKNDPIVRQQAPSAEYSLMCERQRSHVFSGVCDYEIRDGQIAVLAGDQLYRWQPRGDLCVPVRFMEPEQRAEPMDYSDGSGTRGCSAEHQSAASSRQSTSGGVASSQPPEDASSGGNFVSCAKFCPAKPDLLAYVLNKQVYIDDRKRVIFHTSSSSKHITNGVPSYIVQEELERFEGIWWSPNKTRLLYEHVNETAVQMAQFGVNGETPSVPMKYPKAGSPNASTSLHLVIIDDNGRVHKAELPERVLRKHAPNYEYITRAGFFSDGTSVWVQVMSRDQSECMLLLIPETDFDLPRELRDATPPPKGVQLSNDLNMGTWNETSADEELEKPPRGKLQETVVIHRARSADAWINVHNAIWPLKVEDAEEPLYEFIYCLEKPNGSVLALISAELDMNGYCRHTSERLLHSDQFSTNKSVSIVVDEGRSLVYFVSNESHPTEWNVCAANYRTGSMSLLTPRGLSVKPERSHPKLAVHVDYGFVCWVNSSGAPPDCRFFPFRFEEGHDLPQVTHSPNTYQVVHSSQPCPDGKLDVPEMVEYISRRTGLASYAMVMRPSNFTATKKYPVMHYVYGGPGIQTIMNDYTWINWVRWTRLGYVVVMLDNRGTANRGIDYERQLSKRMGSVEVEDQVDGLYTLAERSGGYMDLQRVFVHGWSYGGYMALQMIAKHPQVYCAALAGGAVYDWKLYDTAYTERYLGYPVEEHVYDACSLGRIVDRLPEEPGRLMIIHGLMDENVHFSHTAGLIDALIKAGKWHELLVFPHERHGIRNNDASIYLDARMMHFAQKAIATPMPAYTRPTFNGPVLIGTPLQTTTTSQHHHQQQHQYQQEQDQ